MFINLETYVLIYENLTSQNFKIKMETTHFKHKCLLYFEHFEPAFALHKNIALPRQYHCPNALN
jgi:hypothetical protein